MNQFTFVKEHWQLPVYEGRFSLAVLVVWKKEAEEVGDSESWSLRRW